MTTDPQGIEPLANLGRFSNPHPRPLDEASRPRAPVAPVRLKGTRPSSGQYVINRQAQSELLRESRRRGAVRSCR